MAQFEIITGVAIPPQKHGPGFGPREPKYPFAQLAVGDLLVIEGVQSKNLGSTVRNAEDRNAGFYFTMRNGPVVAENGETVVAAGSVGVWRIATKPERKEMAPLTPEQKAARLAKGAATRARNKAAKAA
jgi:hypothetical protein